MVVLLVMTIIVTKVLQLGLMGLETKSTIIGLNYPRPISNFLTADPSDYHHLLLYDPPPKLSHATTLAQAQSW